MEYNVEQAWCLKWLLDAYCQHKGQRVNFSIFELFVSPNMDSEDKNILTKVFGVKCVDKPGIYLGTNMDFTAKKGSIFARALNKIEVRLGLWKAPLLSFASRLILINHVLLSIPIYLLSIFRAPVYFLNKVHVVTSRFLWFGEKEKGLVWKNWAACCLPKSKGGLGLRDLGCLNQALLAKVAWRLQSDPSSLLSKVLLGKYCQHSSFLDTKVVSYASWDWRSILWGKELLCKGLKWRIGNGETINVFQDEWLPNSANPFMSQNRTCNLFFQILR